MAGNRRAAAMWWTRWRFTIPRSARRVLPRTEMQRAIELARRHNFLVVFDECYAELYDDAPPSGALDVLAAMDASGHWLDNTLVLHSLSKRSSAAGLRSGFAVGAPESYRGKG